MEYTIYIYIYLQETLWFPTMQQVFPSHALIDDQRNHSRFAVCLVWWFRHLSGRPFYPCMRRESHACNQRICWRFFFPCLFGFLLGNLSGPCCSFKSSPRWGSIFGSGSGASFAWPKKGNGTPIGFGLQNFDQHLEHIQGKTHVHGRI